jgi:hypothetical protein
VSSGAKNPKALIRLFWQQRDLWAAKGQPEIMLPLPQRQTVDKFDHPTFWQGSVRIEAT